MSQRRGKNKYRENSERIYPPEHSHDAVPHPHWRSSYAVSLHKLDGRAQTLNLRRCRHTVRPDLEEAPAVNMQIDRRTLVIAKYELPPTRPVLLELYLGMLL